MGVDQARRHQAAVGPQHPRGLGLGVAGGAHRHHESVAARHPPARQLAAVESAVTAAKRVLIHDHIDHCLSHDEDSVLAEMKALTKLL